MPIGMRDGVATGNLVNSHPLLTNATATGAGSTFELHARQCTFQATGTTTAGSGAATIAIRVSNDKVTWLTLGTISLTLSTVASGDGFASDAAWAYVRANVTAISGTGASVTVTMGV